MIQLVYTSLAERPFSDLDLVELLAKARRNNAALDVTGMLVYNDQTFMQVLEGDEQAVSALFDKIGGDTRHCRVQHLLTSFIDRRSFGDWSMGFYNANVQGVDQLPGYQDFFGKGFSKHLFAANPVAARKILLAFREGKWRHQVEASEAAIAE